MSDEMGLLHFPSGTTVNLFCLHICISDLHVLGKTNVSFQGRPSLLLHHYGWTSALQNTSPTPNQNVFHTLFGIISLLIRHTFLKYIS